MIRTIIAAYRAAFAGLSREAWLLALVAFVNRSGTMVLPFLALYLTRERDFTPVRAGQYLALWGVGSTIGSYLGGRFADRYSPKLVQVTALFGGGGMFILLGQLESPLAIALGVFVTAVVLDSLRPANMAAMAAAVPPDRRTRAFALLRLAVNLGATIGPALGGFLAVIDYGWLFLIDGVTCLAAGAICVFAMKPRPPRAPSDHGKPTASPWSDRVFLGFLVLVFLCALVFLQIEGTFPLYLNEHYGLREDRIGVLFTVNTILIVAFEMVLVRWIERFSILKMVALGTLLMGLGLALLPWGSGMSFVVFTVVVWTIGEMLSSPTMMSFVSSRAAEENRGRYMSMFTIAFSAAFVCAPLVGTAIYQGLGPDWVWHFAMLITVIAVFGLMALERHRIYSAR